jgi:hypothetical protein
MAHFAEIDENSVVLRVLVVPDAEENRGQEFLADDLELGGTWVQTSYNANIRKNYAGIGYTYDAERDAFIAPKPYESWVLDEDTCQWQTPTPRPDSIDGEIWLWNEEKLEWEIANA